MYPPPFERGECVLDMNHLVAMLLFVTLRECINDTVTRSCHGHHQSGPVMVCFFGCRDELHLNTQGRQLLLLLYCPPRSTARTDSELLQ